MQMQMQIEIHYNYALDNENRQVVRGEQNQRVSLKHMFRVSLSCTEEEGLIRKGKEIVKRKQQLRKERFMIN